MIVHSSGEGESVAVYDIF